MGLFGGLIRKHWRPILFILALIFIFGLLWAFRGILMPFVIGFIIAYLLLPIIRWVEKRVPVPGRKKTLRKLIRFLAILVIYILVLGIIGLLIFYLVNIIIDAVGTIKLNTSKILPNGLDTVKNWLKALPFLSNTGAQQGIENYFNDFGSQLPTILINFLTQGWQIVQTSAGTVAAFIVLPIFIFYMLYDWEKLRDGFYGGMTPWVRKYTEGVFKVFQNVIIRYIRGELILGFTVGLLAWVMLLGFGIKFALPLAIFSGATELVPMIGPWIGGGLGVLVTLAVAPEKALWVGIGYVVIQLLENQLLVPRIQGAQLEINPAVVIVLSILGAYFAGILGFIIILPLTMIIVKLYRYFRDNAFNEEVPAES